MRWCLFCSHRASTKEHVFPLWLIAALNPGALATIHSERGSQPPRQWRGNEVSAKCVCDRCNNGWMSTLEGRMKSDAPLLLGNGTGQIDLAAQTMVAVWATKTAMVFEALRVDPPWFYSDRERDLFRLQGRPPARTTVWIGKCAGHTGVYCSAFDMNGHVFGTDQATACYLTTMAFGSLAIQIASGRFPDSIPMTATISVEETEGPWEQALTRVWPVASATVSWPPPVHLAGLSGLEALEERWGPHSSSD